MVRAWHWFSHSSVQCFVFPLYASVPLVQVPKYCMSVTLAGRHIYYFHYTESQVLSQCKTYFQLSPSITIKPLCEIEHSYSLIPISPHSFANKCAPSDVVWCTLNKNIKLTCKVMVPCFICTKSLFLSNAVYKCVYVPIISVCNEVLLWRKIILIGWALAPHWVHHACAPAWSYEIHRLGPNSYISIDWFPYINCNSVKSVKLLHVAFIFWFSISSNWSELLQYISEFCAQLFCCQLFSVYHTIRPYGRGRHIPREGDTTRHN
jgi:hypothetical protein